VETYDVREKVEEELAKSRGELDKANHRVDALEHDLATLKLNREMLAKTQAELTKEKKRTDIAENDKLEFSQKLTETQGQLNEEKARVEKVSNAAATAAVLHRKELAADRKLREAAEKSSISTTRAYEMALSFQNKLRANLGDTQSNLESSRSAHGNVIVRNQMLEEKLERATTTGFYEELESAKRTILSLKTELTAEKLKDTEATKERVNELTKDLEAAMAKSR
jgi:Tfp pilus assembly protein PilV